MTPDDLDTLVYDLRTCNNAARRKRLLDHWRAESIAQEATIAHLREEAEHWQALWQGEADRAQALEEELTKVTKCLTGVK